MGKLKTYEATSVFLSLPIEVDGVMQRIRFEHGTTQPYRKNGIFTTANEAMQKALEADEAYGKKFVLKGQSATMTDKDDATTDVVKSTSEDKGVATKKGEVVKDVSDYREAQKWVVENKGVKYEDVSSKAKLVEKCKELGVTFEGYEL